nr:hypothetical protein Iba_chr14fCG13590 [Ipomoea batatas]
MVTSGKKTTMLIWGQLEGNISGSLVLALLIQVILISSSLFLESSKSLVSMSYWNCVLSRIILNHLWC